MNENINCNAAHSNENQPLYERPNLILPDKALRKLNELDKNRLKQITEIALIQGLTVREYVMRDYEEWEKSRIKPSPEPESELVQSFQMPQVLRPWPQNRYNASPYIVRTPMFAVFDRKKPRKHLHRQKLKTWGNDNEVIFSGVQLDQADFDVFLALIELQRGSILGESVKTTPAEIAKLAGKSSGKGTMEWAIESLRRLSMAHLEMRSSQFVCIGNFVNLIGDLTKDEIRFSLNPYLSEIFFNPVYQLMEIRQKLKKPLSKWLYAQICSHSCSAQKPFCPSLQTLYELSGSTTKRVRDFRVYLEGALKEINECGCSLKWQFFGNKSVEIVKF